MAVNKINPATAKYVREMTCDHELPVLSFNNGLPSPCLEWSIEEAAAFRQFMTEENELMTSGFVTNKDAMILGNKFKYQSFSLDVGNVRTQANGVRDQNQCGITFNPVTMTSYQKAFYAMRYELNVSICPKELIGTAWQDSIGSNLGDYDPEKMGETTMGEILLMRIIEEFKWVMPKTFILGVFGADDPDANGDYGVFAKAFFARNGQSYDTRAYDLPTDTQNILAIVGGREYKKLRSEFLTYDQYILDFVEWLNTRKSTTILLMDASVNITAGTLYVASTQATEEIPLRMVYSDTATSIDWLCQETYAQQVTYIQYGQRSQYAETPLLFEYENIDRTNFVPYFSNRLTEYKRHIRTNSVHGRKVQDSDIMIGIDPLLMLEYDQWLFNKNIECCDDNGETANFVGLRRDRFKPLHILEDTGYFFIATRGLLLMFSDTGSPEVMGEFKFKESKTEHGVMDLITNLPLVGNSVEDFNFFAANILNSPLVLDNDLANVDPDENTKLQLSCYDPNTLVECNTVATCDINTNTTFEAVYDDVTDITNVTVTTVATSGQGTNFVYEFNWSSSDGSSSGNTPQTTPVFVIPFVGDVTNSGYSINVIGTVSATAGTSGCSENVVESFRLGTGTPAKTCVTVTNAQADTAMTNELQLDFVLPSGSQSVAFTDIALSLAGIADPVVSAAIVDEIEAILPDTVVTLTGDATTFTITIDNLDTFVTDVQIISNDSGETVSIDQPCA